MRLSALLLSLGITASLLAQPPSSNDYKALDMGSFTFGGYSVNAPSQNFGLNTWWELHEMTSANYSNFADIPSGFIFNCLNVPVPSIAFTNDTLRTDPATAYQWYLNGSQIPGANMRDYKPGATGDYHAIVTYPGGCMESTDTLFVLISAFPLVPGNEDRLNIYPNPFTNSFEVLITSAGAGRVQIAVMDPSGRIIGYTSGEITKGQNPFSFHLANTAAGMYVVTVSTDQWRTSRSIIHR